MQKVSAVIAKACRKMLSNRKKPLMDEDECVVRTYREGDEKALTSFFNKVYKDCAGFVPRTPEYWQWCYLARPTVERKGICVIEGNGKIVGYTVVEITTRGPKMLCNVLEFCYNHINGKAVVRKLLTWILDYARSMKADCILLDAPVYDDLLGNAVEEFGFAESPYVQLLMRIVSFSELLKEMVASRKALLKDLNEVFLVRLSDAPPVFDSSITLQIRDNRFDVVLGETCIPTITVNTDVATFTSCIFGVTGNVFKEIFSLKLRVHPFWKLFKVAKLFSILRLEEPWFVPAGDFG